MDIVINIALAFIALISLTVATKAHRSSEKYKSMDLRIKICELSTQISRLVADNKQKLENKIRHINEHKQHLDNVHDKLSSHPEYTASGLEETVTKSRVLMNEIYTQYHAELDDVHKNDEALRAAMQVDEPNADLFFHVYSFQISQQKILSRAIDFEIRDTEQLDGMKRKLEAITSSFT
ncbi:MAG: hypothetical protein AAGI68_06255 [Planctomycetota bacterium]